MVSFAILFQAKKYKTNYYVQRNIKITCRTILMNIVTRMYFVFLDIKKKYHIALL
jgi:hypothetical protein